MVMQEKDTYHHGDLRQEIIKEALSWIESENIDRLSLRGIARKIGVSHNAPYRHFVDKNSLLAAIATEGFQQLSQTLQQILNNTSDNPQQQLEAIGVAYIKFALNNVGYYRVMFGSFRSCDGEDPSLEIAAQEAFNVLVDVIKQGQQTRAFANKDTLQLTRACWSLVHGVSMLAIDRQLALATDDSVIELASLATRMMSQGLSSDITK